MLCWLVVWFVEMDVVLVGVVCLVEIDKSSFAYTAHKSKIAVSSQNDEDVESRVDRQKWWIASPAAAYLKLLLKKG